MPLRWMSMNQVHSGAAVASGGARRVRLRSGTLLAPPRVLTSCCLPSLPTWVVVETSTSRSRPETPASEVITSPSISRKKFWAISGSVEIRSLGIGHSTFDSVTKDRAGSGRGLLLLADTEHDELGGLDRRDADLDHELAFVDRLGRVG